MRTAFTELVGCTAPVQLAAMPAVSGPKLVAAVANAGGLAMSGAPLAEPDQLVRHFRQLREMTDGAIGVNFLMPFFRPDCLEAVVEMVRVVEFFYDWPDAALIETVHRADALAAWQVGSAAEATAAVEAGIDFLIVQGTEAGGHVRATASLLPLLGTVLDQVTVPVLAAGGIATGRDLAAVLAAGAAGARVGTRFLVSAESDAHPDYLDRLLAADASDTVLTEAFSVMWPNAPHRVLASAVDAAQALAGQETIGEMLVDDTRVPVPRLSVFPPSRGATGHVEAMALYAGESVASIRTVEPAAAILAELVDGAARALRRATDLA